jgi:hypothetical protein
MTGRVSQTQPPGERDRIDCIKELTVGYDHTSLSKVQELIVLQDGARLWKQAQLFFSSPTWLILTANPCGNSRPGPRVSSHGSPHQEKKAQGSR